MIHCAPGFFSIIAAVTRQTGPLSPRPSYTSPDCSLSLSQPESQANHKRRVQRGVIHSDLSQCVISAYLFFIFPWSYIAGSSHSPRYAAEKPSQSYLINATVATSTLPGRFLSSISSSEFPDKILHQMWVLEGPAQSSWQSLLPHLTSPHLAW